MKNTAIKVAALLVCTLLVLGLLPAFVPVALAEGETPNPTAEGYYWSKDETGVTITYYVGTDANISIPSRIDGADVVKIGDGAFSQASIRNAIIPEGVTEIGMYAFYNCPRLTTVTLPASLVTIGQDVFGYCVNLVGFELSSGNASFTLDGNGVLFDAEKTRLIISPPVNSRTSYTVPDTVTSIDPSAFSNNSKLVNITIPDTVTAIGMGAFYNCSSLTVLTLPDGIETIGDAMFQNCVSLQTLSLPEGLKSIASAAFYNCSSLTNVTLPSGLESIGSSTFSQSGITGISIPSTTESIDDSAFSYCASLAEFTVESSNTVFQSRDGVLFKIKNARDESMLGLFQYPSAKSGAEYVIPEETTYLYPGSFNACDNLESVSIPENIGFADPNNPEYGTAADFSAFRTCAKLSTFLTPGEHNKFRAVDGVLYSSDMSYLYYYTMTKPDIEFELPREVNDIRCFFTDCKSIEAFTVEEGNVSYFARDGVLYDVKGINTEPEYQIVVMFGYPQGKTDELLTIPPKIEYPAGSGNEYTLGLEVGSIAGNKYIKHVVYAPGNRCVGSHQFGNCVNLEQVDIPEGVTRIGLCVFYNCPKLKSITIPASVECIEEQAFEGCTGLKTVTFAGGGTAAKAGAKSAAAGASLTTIQNGAFTDCKSLTSLDIPSSVTEIGSSVFAGCDSLAAINVGSGNTVYSSQSGVLYDRTGAVLLQYPMNKPGSVFIVPASVRLIADGAFADFRNLTKIGIPASVQTIDTFAFPPDAKNRLTIYGTAGSQAQLYAQRAGIPFSTQALQCKVTFDSRLGSAVPAQTVTAGSKAAAPANPTRSGYVFGGWYQDTACTKPWNFTVDAVTRDITLYAKWTAIQKPTPSAYLSGIKLSAGALSPAFKSTVTKYTVTLKETDAGVTITPVKAYSGAVMTISGARVSSKTIAVKNGKSVTVTVRVQYGRTTKTYTLTVKRPKSTDNRLSSLKVSAGALSPAYHPTVTSYTLTLPESTSRVTVTAAKSSPLATISGTKRTYSLKNGQTVYDKIKVRSQSGVTKTYTVAITRAKSTNADLAYLKTSSSRYPLKPAFKTGTTSYAITLPKSVPSVRLYWKAAGYKAVATVDGRALSSKTISLKNGQSCTVIVTVKSQAGNTKTYTIVINRE